MTMVRGIRGAITVKNNSKDDILEATQILLNEIIIANEINIEDVCSVIFTATSDLDSAYPAVAARNIGWVQVPLLCMNELEIKNSLRKVIRVLIHYNTSKSQSEIKHIYLRDAKKLRLDLAKK